MQLLNYTVFATLCLLYIDVFKYKMKSNFVPVFPKFDLLYKLFDVFYSFYKSYRNIGKGFMNVFYRHLKAD